MPCVDNKDLIYNIKELQETFSITSGDLLVVETEEGTNIMDYDNLIIGLDNTTFGTTITDNTADISTLSATVDDLSSASQTVLAAAGNLESSVGFTQDTVLLAENGYQILPSGLIMQWGVSSRSTVSFDEITVTFPMAFNAACLNIVGQIDADTTTTEGFLDIFLKESNTTSATFQFQIISTSEVEDVAIRWQAFGF